MKRYVTYVGAIVGVLLLHVLSLEPAAAALLASDQVRILGIRLEVSPATLDAPRNVPILINTALKDGADNDVSSAPTLANWKVRGELSGPGLDGVVPDAPLPAPRPPR
jgi:hypothetical protein